ncbi:MAG: glycosyltransferase [Planctomycetota bacterium]
MSKPELTVIMPVRNGGSYLGAALESLRSQTCRDFVLHVWDDGSTDDTAALLKRWVPNRLPGRVLGHEPIGIGRALARLVESAGTPLIARMDADDVCHPQRFARQLAHMQQHPRVAALGTQMQRRDATLTQTRRTTRMPTRDRDVRWMLRTHNPLNHPTVMMRRLAVLDCGNYHDLRPGQDDDLWLRLAFRHRLANLPEPLLLYREHDHSVTASQLDQSAATFRARRRASAALVFPGLAEDEAQRLTDLLADTKLLGVGRDDVQLLERAARTLAQQSGEPADYFIDTPRYRQQRDNLKTRRLKSNPVIRPAWPALRKLGRLVTTPAKAGASGGAAA